MNQDARKYGKSRSCSLPEPGYGFFGRETEILKIENDAFKQNNMLLVQAAGGAGKTALISHLARSWQADRKIDKVFYFSFHERTWKLEQILLEIGDSLLPEKDRQDHFRQLTEKGRTAAIVETLRERRHLLILEDLEFISNHLLIADPGLSKNERRRIKTFLTRLSGGATRVLLSSKDTAPWLSSTTFKDQVLHLGALDSEATQLFCERILEKHGSALNPKDDELQRLIAFLKARPLALEVVLPDLEDQAPVEIITALGLKDAGEDTPAGHTVIDAIEFIYRMLPLGARCLLACLSPVADVINPEFLVQYGQQLKKQKPLENLNVDQFTELIQEAFLRKLIQSHCDVPDFFKFRPPMPYLLKKIMDQLDPETQDAIQAAFVVHYGVVCWSIADLINSEEESKRKIGYLLIWIEYENILSALKLALDRQTSIMAIFSILHRYIEKTRDYRKGLAIGEPILKKLKSYSQETMNGPIGAEFVNVMRCIAQYHLGLENYEGARQFYQKALDLHMNLEFLPQDQKIKASTEHYHILGATAQRLGSWQEAENYYRQAEEVCIRFNDRRQLADTYRRMAIIAQAQNQWQKSNDLLQKTLDIFVECNDRSSQGRTCQLLGVSAEEQKNWEQAEKFYRQALDIGIELNDPHGQASAYHHLGSVAQVLEQWQKAEICFQKALDIFVECSDPLSQGRAYHHLGTIAQEQRQWRKAGSFYDKALHIFIELDDPFLQAGTYQNMAISAQQQELWPEAGTFFFKALECFSRCRDEQNTLLSLSSLFNLNELAEVQDLYGAIARILQRTPEEIRTIHDLWKAEA